MSELDKIKIAAEPEDTNTDPKPKGNKETGIAPLLVQNLVKRYKNI